MDTLEIKLLADYPKAIPILKELFESEWEPYYGKSGPGDAESDLTSSTNRTQLPIALVALKNGIVCGSAALKSQSVTVYPDLSPWLAALVVAPEFRKSGIGAKLIAEIERLANTLGYVEIYVGVGEKSGLSEDILVENNWKFISEKAYYTSKVRVFRKTF